MMTESFLDDKSDLLKQGVRQNKSAAKYREYDRGAARGSGYVLVDIPVLSRYHIV